MSDPFGVYKAAYFKAPTYRGAKQAATEMLKAPKKRGKLTPAPHLDRKNYIAADGVQVRWRGGVGKSFVPGKGYSVVTGSKGYKRAVDLTREERAAVKGNPIPKKIGERGGRLKMAARRDAAGKSRTEIWPGTKTPHGKLTKVIPSSRDGVHPSLQAHSQPNGRGGGTVHIYHGAQDMGHTMRHERAHIEVKRNPVRFQERYGNETRRGREEGRADFTASKGPSTGRYPGGDEFQRGYNEVQGKMAAAKFRRKLGGNGRNS